MMDDSLDISTQPDELLDDLTPPQREAATHVDGPLLILAGAGSGKTRTITRRVAHLVLRVGIAPWNVLAITFTNKAAGEMRERVGQLVSQRQARALSVTTFHSFCARVIREYADHLGLTRGYSIYDTADQTRAMKAVLSDLHLGGSANFTPASMLSRISTAKNELIGPDEFAQGAGDFFERCCAKAYKAYQAQLQRSNALDFDDLLVRTVELMRTNADVRRQLQERYQYILIDEYQDTNRAQFLIASTLAAEHKNLCVTGDPDQSIYAWRGADIRNILDFEEHFPTARTVLLEQNYRSTKTILATANELISHNTQRKRKTLWTDNDEGMKVYVTRCADEQHEARTVAQRIVQLHEQLDLPWSDFGIFYRMNSLSRGLEAALRQCNVPYQIARGTAFYDRKEIKDAVAYLRAILNPRDEVYLQRVINTPARGISDRTTQAMSAYAMAHGLPIDDVLRDPGQVESLNTRAVNAVTRFSDQMRTWRRAAGLVPHPSGRAVNGKLKDFVWQVIRESGLHDYYAADKTDPDNERIANLGELVSYAQQFEEEFDAAQEQDGPGLTSRKLEAMLEQIALMSDIDTLSDGSGCVSLLTLHAAKGLEFPVVLIVGLEDGLLPHSRAERESATGIEEERRLLFVGVTRAQQVLVLSHANVRTVFGETQNTIPSRFLSELPREHLKMQGYGQESSRSYTSSDASDSRFGASGGAGTSSGISAREIAAAASSGGELTRGSIVRHPKFGRGTVESVSPSGVHTRVTVAFATGRKNLILEYARLERIVG